MIPHEGSSVCVGFLSAYHTGQLIYSLNTVFAQEFGISEIRFYMEDNPGISMSEVLDCIHAHNDEIRADVSFALSADTPANRLLQLLRDTGCSHLILFTANSAFYDRSSLGQLMVSFSDLRCLAAAADTLLYSEGNNPKRIGPDAFFSGGPLSRFCCVYEVDPLFRYLSCADLSLPPESLLRDYLTTHSFCKIPPVCMRQESAGPKRALEAPKPTEDAALNYTDSVSLTHLIRLASAVRSQNENAEKLRSRIQWILVKQQGGVWPLNQSKRLYIEYLDELSRIPAGSLGGILRRRQFRRRVREHTDGRIRLAFFTMEYAVWPSFQSLYDYAAARPEKFHVSLVYVPFSHVSKTRSDDSLIDEYRRAGYPIQPADNYDLAADSPDVAFFLKPYNSVPKPFYISEVEKSVPRCVYIPYFLGIEDDERTFLPSAHSPTVFLSWKVLSYGPFFIKTARKHTYNHARNFIPSGHPRIDIKPETDPALEKRIAAAGPSRKVVLWNTHFTIEPNVGRGSFLEFKDVVLKAAAAHPGILLLWRPHPLFLGAYARYTNRSAKDILREMSEWEKEGLLLVDQSPSYLSGFCRSQALITDASSLLYEYLYQNKPILFTPKAGGTGLYDKELEKQLLRARGYEDFDHFFMALEQGNPLPVVDASRFLYLPKHGSVASNFLESVGGVIAAEEQLK